MICGVAGFFLANCCWVGGLGNFFIRSKLRGSALVAVSVQNLPDLSTDAAIFITQPDSSTGMIADDAVVQSDNYPN